MTLRALKLDQNMPVRVAAQLWSAYQLEEESAEFFTSELDELAGRMARYSAEPSTATDVDGIRARLLAKCA